MSYGLSVVSSPAEEPVTTEAAKAHLRVEHNADDSYIGGLVSAARGWVEARCRRALVTQTLRMSLDSFPPVIRLPRSPVQSVAQIQYVDLGGATQTLDASKYRLDSESLVPRITPAYGDSWPPTQAVTNAVTVTFVAGYGGAAAVPEELKQAIKLLVGTYYDPVRQTVIVGGAASPMPHAAEYLVGPFRIMGVD